MEEWVGARWHRFIWQAADASFPKAAVRLEDVQRAVQMLFRAGGGDAIASILAGEQGIAHRLEIAEGNMPKAGD